VAVEEGIEVVVVVVGAVGVGAVLQHPAQVPLNVEAVGVAADQTTSFITVLLMPLAVSIAIAIMTGRRLIAVFVKIDL